MSAADDIPDTDIPDTEVLVVGAGPTGLAAAIALGRLGVRTLVVERRATTSTHPRGHVENGRTMELFRLWGVEDRVRQAGLPRTYLGGVSFMTRMAGIELGRIEFSEDAEWLMGHDGEGPAALSSTPQDRLEPILLEAARALDSVTVHFGRTLDRLASSPDGVSALLTHENGTTETVAAQYAIAADGPRSAVRESLGIDMEGPGTLGTQLGIYFHADLSRFTHGNKNALYWLYNPDAQGVIISLDGDQRWHLLFAYDSEREAFEDYPPERCESIVRGLIGDASVDIDIRSILPWRMRAAVATSTRSDRIFLAGDAAHTMPPTGGMGMNTGIGDAHNLAWKLQAVLRGQAGPELLDTYQMERLPVGQRNTENSLSNAKTMAESGLAGILTSDPEGFATIEQPEGQEIRRRLGEAAAGQLDHFSFDGLSFGYTYVSAAVLPDGTPDEPSGVGEYRPSARPGARAPHVWLERGGTEVSTIDLSDGRFVVLTPSRDWVAAAQQASNALGVALDAFVVGTNDADLIDATGRWAELYGVGDDGAVLVRPDGHVAWRTTAAPQAEEINDALRAMLLRA
ncbi:MAG: FAD-dependent monooxygenase [Nocardioidaceae bacterium]